MRTWITKHLRDLGSGKPECDVSVHLSVDDLLREIAEMEEYGFQPWDEADDEWADIGGWNPEHPRTWALDSGFGSPDEYFEVEPRELGLQWTAVGRETVGPDGGQGVR